MELLIAAIAIVVITFFLLVIDPFNLKPKPRETEDYYRVDYQPRHDITSHEVSEMLYYFSFSGWGGTLKQAHDNQTYSHVPKPYFDSVPQGVKRHFIIMGDENGLYERPIHL